MTVAALYVATGGVYFNLDDVDPWDQDRDARQYRGPHPVVAHPPCARWGRYWYGSPSLPAEQRRHRGDDDGCFAAALWAVRTFGGVLEHPADSSAWEWFGLRAPPRAGGWMRADSLGGWTCSVEQGAYGHRGRKATWLYAVDTDLPELLWGRAPGDFTRLDEGYHSASERRCKKPSRGMIERLSSTERLATPLPFRDLLLDLARSVHGRRRSA